MDDMKDTVQESQPEPQVNTSTLGDQVRQLQTELAQVRRENDLIVQMAQRGVVDIEAAALLISRKHAGEGGDDNIDALIEQLRQDRPWLFGRNDQTAPAMNQPTAAVRSERNTDRIEMDKAARQARQSGQRRDLIAYLRLRRLKRGR